MIARAFASAVRLIVRPSVSPCSATVSLRDCRTTASQTVILEECEPVIHCDATYDRAAHGVDVVIHQAAAGKPSEIAATIAVGFVRDIVALERVRGNAARDFDAGIAAGSSLMLPVVIPLLSAILRCLHEWSMENRGTSQDVGKYPRHDSQ